MYINSIEAKKIGKENMNFQWGASLLILALYTILLVAGNAIPVIGCVLISGPLFFGLNYVYYRASFKEKINGWDLFKGFEMQFGDSFLAFVLVQVFSFLWSLLFIVPGIIKRYSYAMYMYILMREPELTATEAIAKSVNYMYGHKWRLFCLDLSFLGWTILEAITGGLLSVYVAPWRMHAKIAFYNDLYEKKKAEESGSANNAEAAQAEDAKEESEVKFETPSNDDMTVDPKFIVEPEKIDFPEQE